MWRAERAPAIGRFHVLHSIAVGGGRRELAKHHIHVAVAGHRDTRELDVLHVRGEVLRAGPRDTVIGGTCKVDVAVRRRGAGEPRPGEVDVAIARSARAVDLEGGLVVELSGPWAGRPLGHRHRPLEALPIVGGIPGWS